MDAGELAREMGKTGACLLKYLFQNSNKWKSNEKVNLLYCLI
jgi:hypothetical protein